MVATYSGLMIHQRRPQGQPTIMRHYFEGSIISDLNKMEKNANPSSLNPWVVQVPYIQLPQAQTYLDLPAPFSVSTARTRASLKPCGRHMGHLSYRMARPSSVSFVRSRQCWVIASDRPRSALHSEAVRSRQDVARFVTVQCLL